MARVDTCNVPAAGLVADNVRDDLSSAMVSVMPPTVTEPLATMALVVLPTASLYCCSLEAGSVPSISVPQGWESLLNVTAGFEGLANFSKVMIFGVEVTAV